MELSVLGLKGVCPELHISTGEAEEPTATDDRHLSHRIKHGVTAEHSDAAAVVIALHEDKVLCHQEGNLVLARLSEDAPCAQPTIFEPGSGPTVRGLP